MLQRISSGSCEQQVLVLSNAIIARHQVILSWFGRRVLLACSNNKHLQCESCMYLGMHCVTSRHTLCLLQQYKLHEPSKDAIELAFDTVLQVWALSYVQAASRCVQQSACDDVTSQCLGLCLQLCKSSVPTGFPVTTDITCSLSEVGVCVADCASGRCICHCLCLSVGLLHTGKAQKAAQVWFQAPQDW